MYNRYIRNDQGTYTRIPQEESPQPQTADPVSERTAQTGAPHADFTEPPIPPPAGKRSQITDTLAGTLRHILDQLHLDHVDTGDLLLLGLLFFLFREDADEELLAALGLLLIL